MIKNHSLLKIVSVLLSLISVNLNAQSPCFTTPGTNTIVLSSLTICPGALGSMSLANSYSVSGITYQWQSSTISPVGPFSAIPGATLNTYGTPTLNMNTYYAVVITCTNVNATFFTSSILLNIAPPTTTNSVPYTEGFEGITTVNQLPNCSWSAANLVSSVNTYTSSQTNNRVPRTGSKFAVFALPSTNNTVYSSGIKMNPGLTYSTGVYFTTDYSGSLNWTNLELLVGPNQSTTALSPVAALSPAVSGPYQLLSGTFTVPSSGFYYMALRANASTGAALYLSFDDLFVTVPCNGSANGATITVSPATPTLCVGSAFSATATGADIYTWSNGATGPVFTGTVSSITPLSVIGTKTLSTCIGSKTLNMVVNPTPNVLAFGTKSKICLGESIIIAGLGASTYSWASPSVTSSTINITPTVTGCYTVTGANTYSCQSQSVWCVTVNPLPVLNASVSNPSICAGEASTLTAIGNPVYQWEGFPPGNPVIVNPTITSTFTLNGTDANACTAKLLVSVNVNACLGISANKNENSFFKLYPNPTKSNLSIDSQEAGLITLVDVSGRIVMTSKLEKGNSLLNTSQLAAGIYYVQLTAVGKQEVFKLVKE